ncbi:hypothetical protein EPD60_08425 [Flaviaesturariibacter flavus]|uniref:Pyruvoyl-dependent arginine decarboxylase AaxB n=1 Tax=Flaviaesturariibacter flavus TaxID=2502780 RepID=A0A4R1BAQ2_9BACT|nr:hypothetical protein EPD60_08425 [Flaviaesturariibacter flavus]
MVQVMRKVTKCHCRHEFYARSVMKLIPTRYFLTKGIGVHEKELRSFEEALRQAGIETCNLIRISSVIAPGCKRISREEGLKTIHTGMMTFSVQAILKQKTRIALRSGSFVYSPLPVLPGGAKVTSVTLEGLCLPRAKGDLSPYSD